MRFKSDAILRSASNQKCTARIYKVCNYDPTTTVSAHAPDITRGKSEKTNDFWIAYMCSSCHYAIDHHQVDNPDSIWLSAIRETLELIIAQGLITASENKERQYKPSSKIVPRRGICG